MGCGSSSSQSNVGSPGAKKGGVVYGYFAGIRGGPRANGTYFLLNYCKVQYTEKLYSMDNGLKEWKDAKPTLDVPFADLPYLTDGDAKVTQTMAIHQYIAAKYKPELIGSSPAEKAHVYQMLCLVFDAFAAFLGMGMKTADQMEIYEKAKESLAPIVECLTRQNFICGDKVTLPDFSLFETINYLNALGCAQGGMSDSSKAF